MTEVCCPYCNNHFPMLEDTCPHCAGGPTRRFPNVELAKTPEEVAALEDRYNGAIVDARQRQCESEVKEFEHQARFSRAVINRDLHDLEWLNKSDLNLYATYYQKIDAGIQIPSGEKWDVLRGVADEALYGHQKKHIRCGALSLDGLGLSNYGRFSLVLRDEMIAYRANVFEMNSTLFLTHQAMGKADQLPRGHRAPWAERGKLCVAKVATEIMPDVKSSSYPALLLRQGADTGKDEFIEVHVWGPITIRTLERVIVGKCEREMRHGERPMIRKLRWDLERFGVELEDRT